MKEYHKINSVFKRDQNTNRFIMGEYSQPEFEYLAGLPWVWTEKVDGANIRVEWNGESVSFGGRTDNALIPATLVQRLRDLFPRDKFADAELPALTLYGEGYGHKIQKAGSLYKPDGSVDFVLFDVRVGDWWLKWPDVLDVAHKLGIVCVPQRGIFSLTEAIEVVADGVPSQWGSFDAEGLVGTPLVPLHSRDGKRIIVKIKTRDFATAEASK